MLASTERIYCYTYDHEGGHYHTYVTIHSREPMGDLVIYLFAPVHGWPHRGGVKYWGDSQTLILNAAMLTPEEEHEFKHQYLVPLDGVGDS